MVEKKYGKIFEWTRNDSSRIMLYIEGIEKSEIDNIIFQLTEILHSSQNLADYSQ